MKKVFLVFCLVFSFLLNAQIVQLVDSYSKENVNFKTIPVLPTGAVLDGVMYSRKDGKYYKRVYQGEINPSWFGAIPNDGVEDSEAIQRALDYSFKVGQSVKFTPGTYEIAKTVIIPQFVSASGEMITVDFNSSTFKVLTDVSFLKSIAFNTALNAKITKGVYLKNCNIISMVPAPYAVNKAILLQDFVNGGLENISTYGFRGVVVISNNSNMTFKNISGKMHPGVVGYEAFYITNGGLNLTVTNVYFEGYASGINLGTSAVKNLHISGGVMDNVDRCILSTSNFASIYISGVHFKKFISVLHLYGSGSTYNFNDNIVDFLSTRGGFLAFGSNSQLNVGLSNRWENLTDYGYMFSGKMYSAEGNVVFNFFSLTDAEKTQFNARKGAAVLLKTVN